MLYAKIETEDTLYVLLHAEQVYRDFNHYEKDWGFYRLDTDEPNMDIMEATMYDVFQYVEKESMHANIIIDCDLIGHAYNIAEWVKKTIDYCSMHNRCLAFCRMNETLYSDSKIHGKGLNENKNDDGSFNVFSTGCSKNSISDEELYGVYQEIIVEKLNVSGSKYLIERSGIDSYSHSSNVQLPKYINIKAFIEQKFMLFAGLYLLCKKAYEKQLITKVIADERKPLLFFSSMAGSYLASIFSKLACIDMVFLNHLGPKKKLYRELHKEQLLADRDYIIISDVVCLGAEIERAKTLIEYAGGKLKGILSIVLVDVVSERPLTETKIEKMALLTLSKDNNPINYQINTDFQ